MFVFFLFSFLEEDSDTMSVSVLLDGEESSLEFLDVHAQVARFFSTSHFFFQLTQYRFIWLRIVIFFLVNSFSPQWLFFVRYWTEFKLVI